MPGDARLRSLLMKGLREVYSPAEVLDEWDNWLNNQPEDSRAALEQYRASALTSPKVNAEITKRLLLQKIITDGPGFAVFLATQRAAQIIEKRAY